MKGLIATTAIAMTLASMADGAHAASITDGHITLTTAPGIMTVISVTGEIVEGDSASFKRLSSHATGDVYVALASPGGKLVEGLAIGEQIHNLHFMTVAKGECDSVCAYIWLAGTSRAMINGAEVVFHAPYAGDDTAHADGAGNVLVGQYLAEIGISVETSIVISGHGPDDYYVIPADAVNPVVAFTLITDATPTQQKTPQVAQQPVPPPVPQSQPPQQALAPTARPTVLAMDCFPEHSKPYVVVYTGGKSAISTKTGKPQQHTVLEEKDNPSNRIFYVKAQGRGPNTLFYAFDYSQRADDVSAIRVMGSGNGYDAKDKCTMDWSTTK